MRIVIIGGVAGGMSAATRARRTNESAEIVVIERGGFISFANCGLPYHIAGRIAPESKLLLTNPQAVATRFRIDARVGEEAISIDRAAKSATIRRLVDGSTYSLAYDKLILAPGANPIVPKVSAPNATNVFQLRQMEDTRAINAFIESKKPQHAVIVGAGFIGLEMAEALHDREIGVTIVEKNTHVLPPFDQEMAFAIERELHAHEVNVVVGVGLSDLKQSDASVPVADIVQLEDGRQLRADLVLLSIGVRPNVELAKNAGLTIGATGAIAVDAYQRTSDPDVYAVGDAAEVVHGVTGKTTRVPLAGPANRQGRLAGEHAASGKSSPRGRVFGTAAVQVFGVSAALTGLNERAAREAKSYDVDVAYVLPNHHAGYYPGAQQMRIKLVYDRATRKVLGAQAVGGAGVDKRIDVVATVLYFGGTIDDLAQLDLAYAPQFGSAKDALHLAAFVAQNQLDRPGSAVAPADRPKDAVTIDVRTAAEFDAGSIAGAKHIPVDELRERIGELDPAKETVVFCAVGQRGHVAQRILVQHGFAAVRNLKGGFTMHRVCAESNRC
jgi:NADPH-dependent 2,4-dienoyl-CoA reductase/sulfur reductase-like enzyme/rhodanese-related sulfurtransferase